MSIASSSARARGTRTSLELPPGRLWQALERSLSRESLQRGALCLVAAALIWWITAGWLPPFAYQTGLIPSRDLNARVAFLQPDISRTEAERRRARSEAYCVYVNDRQPLTELRLALKNALFRVLRDESFDKADLTALAAFIPSNSESGLTIARQVGEQNLREVFEALRAALAADSGLALLDEALQRALGPFERTGLLASLEHSLEDGSQLVIRVHPLGDEEFLQRVDAKDVRIDEATTQLREQLLRELQSVVSDSDQAGLLATALDAWLRNTGLPTTLHLNPAASEKAREEAAALVQQASFQFRVGDKIAPAGVPLDRANIGRLRIEHEEWLKGLTWSNKINRSLALWGFYVAAYILCGYYIFFHEPSLAHDLRKFTFTLALSVLTVGMCVFASQDAWRAELVPLAIFGLTIAIAYHREMALLFSAVLAMLLTLSQGRDLGHFVVLAASVTAAILLVNRVRSRKKLVYVGLFAAFVAFGTTCGVGTLVGQVFSSAEGWNIGPPQPNPQVPFAWLLLEGATWRAFCLIAAGLLMVGLLPFIERLFDVQTDISLLELGDAAHPLLQELARRAPGTYNHSLNVATLAETAAEAIGANGLLCRVGAYFHDIGKMLKPQYFAENQGATNRHESLMPAMSTLVIIAHVKDGADLARQHHLPRSIIGFIEQHHGTTLVEYFFRQEQGRAESDPDSADVDESSFRYPGPRPQTKEAAVLMLADAVEGAARALGDPAPSRFESLVGGICMKRLLDGQFSDCGLTLSELHIVQEKLVKSLIAVYHGRVKYPGQQTA